MNNQSKGAHFHSNTIEILIYTHMLDSTHINVTGCSFQEGMFLQHSFKLYTTFDPIQYEVIQLC